MHTSRKALSIDTTRLALCSAEQQPAKGAPDDVLDQAREERLLVQVLVVLLGVRPADVLELQGLEHVALLLEALDDLAN